MIDIKSNTGRTRKSWKTRKEEMMSVLDHDRTRGLVVAEFHL